jgi:hypothetical protein
VNWELTTDHSLRQPKPGGRKTIAPRFIAEEPGQKNKTSPGRDERTPAACRVSHSAVAPHLIVVKTTRKMYLTPSIPPGEPPMIGANELRIIILFEGVLAKHVLTHVWGDSPQLVWDLLMLGIGLMKIA